VTRPQQHEPFLISQIDILITNCSLYCPTPSLSSLVVNHFKMRSNIISYSLGGMGCSAGVIAVGLAKELLQARTSQLCQRGCAPGILRLCEVRLEISLNPDLHPELEHRPQASTLPVHSSKRCPSRHVQHLLLTRGQHYTQGWSTMRAHRVQRCGCQQCEATYGCTAIALSPSEPVRTKSSSSNLLRLPQAYPNSRALVLSTENITQNWYFGEDRSMLIPNCLFRVGGAGIVLSNRCQLAFLQ